MTGLKIIAVMQVRSQQTMISYMTGWHPIDSTLHVLCDLIFVHITV